MNATQVYAKLKELMTEAGHVVSEGEEWTAKDASEFRDYAKFTLGAAEHVAQEIIQFPATAAHHFSQFFGELHAKVETNVTKVKTEADVIKTIVEDKADEVKADAVYVVTPAPEPAIVPPAVEAPAAQVPVEHVEESKVTMDVSAPQ